jgi:hypothetical protein
MNTHQLSTISPVRLCYSPPTFLDRLAERRNAVQLMPSGKYTVSDAHAVTGGEREDFANRLAVLQAGLNRTDQDALRKRLTRFFLCFGSQGAGSMEASVDAYCSVLLSVPLFGLDRAFKKIIDAGDVFRPSAGQLKKAAMRECAPLFIEEQSLRIVLTAEVYEQRLQPVRDRMIASFKTLWESLSGTNGMHLAREEARRNVASGFTHLQGPLKVSDALRAANAMKAA